VNTRLEKSAPTNRAEDKPLLHRGVSSYQIFSDGRCVFKLTTTYETLSRYKFYNEGHSNVVEETDTYCRVPQGDPRILQLSRMEHMLKPGHTELFNGVRYDLYALFAGVSYLNNRRKLTGFSGYRLIPREGFKAQPISTLPYDKGMYFVHSKKEGGIGDKKKD